MKQIKSLFMVVFMITLFYSKAFSQEIKAGETVWMARNLEVKQFRNGDPIPYIKSRNEWLMAAYAGEPAWTYYKNKKGNGKKYGIIYNWAAVIDPRGLAPEGWRISTQEDWEDLVLIFGDKENLGNILKTPKIWNDESIGTSGFNAAPGGYLRNDFIKAFDVGLGEECYWWCTPSKFYLQFGTETDLISKSPSTRGLFKNQSGVAVAVGEGLIEMILGAYVRCIKE